MENLIAQMLFRLANSSSHFSLDVYLRRFGALDTNLDRVNYVYKDLKKTNLLPTFVNQDGKDDYKAKLLRETGNQCFVSGKDREAHEFYTRSITLAKTASVLALAYANRSACLFRLGKYQDCLIDIDRAFTNGYPEHLKPKLIDRRKNATILLQAPRSIHEPVPEIAAHEINEKIQCAKSCVQIGVSEERGRHVVATRNIEIGEIISVEPSYMAVLCADGYIRCHECLKICFTAIPCKNCVYFLACSESCRSRAYEKYHKFECVVVKNLVEFQFSTIQIMALRIAVAARAELSDIYTRFKAQEVYCSDRYKEVHGLTTHSDKFAPEELLGLSVIACLMYHMLQTTTFFNGTVSKIYFKEVIMSQLQVAILNRIPILEHVCGFEETYLERRQFGIGIYPFGGLFNHSCHPNVDHFDYGTTMVMRALNTIKAGEECCISYGPTYRFMPRSERRACLQHSHFFTCKCKACEEDWPLNLNWPDPWSLSRDLGMFQMEFCLMTVGLGHSNTEVVKQYLPKFIQKLKSCEEINQLRKSADSAKHLIVCCFGILANKRIL